jgi:small subunit ribosomal protein S16
MALRIRLRRMGRKKAPHYRIVVAESAMPRDGRFVETLGHYNPRTEPMTLVVHQDRAVEWMRKGAKPTETVEKLFKRAGVYEARPAQAAADAARAVASQVAETASRAAAAVTGAVASAADAVRERVSGGAEAVADTAAAASETVAEAAPAAAESASDVVETVQETAAEAVETVREATADAAGSVQKTVADTAEQVSETAAETAAVADASGEAEEEGEERPA